MWYSLDKICALKLINPFGKARLTGYNLVYVIIIFEPLFLIRNFFYVSILQLLFYISISSLSKHITMSCEYTKECFLRHNYLV